MFTAAVKLSSKRRKRRKAMLELRPLCSLCGLEDGACICRWLPSKPKPKE